MKIAVENVLVKLFYERFYANNIMKIYFRNLSNEKSFDGFRTLKAVENSKTMIFVELLKKSLLIFLNKFFFI